MHEIPKKSRNELPVHGAAPDFRPADAFMAEQAAMVAPRREAFARLRLAPEHEALLPDALKARPRESEPARATPAPGVSFDGERPTPDYALPPLPAEKPPRALEPAKAAASDDEE